MPDAPAGPPTLGGVRRSVVVVGLLLASLAGPALADSISLPTPEAARVQQAKLITAVGGRPDRLLASDVPGPVTNDELIHVGLGGDGSVQTVIADQRLRLTGEGDYAIRERGPARAAASLSAEPPPVTRRGAVVWQGFSPGRRELAARLTLDPQLEASRLPLTVEVGFTGAGAVGPGGALPGAGTVSVTIRNVTSQPADLPTADDVSAEVVAGPLDRALAVARRPSGDRLPSTGAGLPASLAVTGAATVASVQAVPFRLTGSMRVEGTTAVLGGPTMAPDGHFAGTLGGSRSGPPAAVTFTAAVDGPGRLVLDLTATAALNPHELMPPGFSSWAAWARSSPSKASRRAALDLLVAVAATGARASSFGPYLGADLAGTGSTTFRYALAPPPAARPKAEARQPQWWALSVVGLVLLLALAGGVVLWRRS
jgi:hypothetical protein